MSEPLPVLNEHLRCRHLRSKGMFINFNMPPGERAVGDGHFWCAQTQRDYGPDDRLCDGTECVDSTRSCYEPQ